MSWEPELEELRGRQALTRQMGGGGSVKTIETTGRANLPGGLYSASGSDITVENMGIVPVVGLGLGSVAGLGAARLVASHYSVMVKEISAVFVAGRLGNPGRLRRGGRRC